MNESISSTTTPDAPTETKSGRGGATIIIIIAVVGILLLAVLYYGILNPPSERVASGTAPAISFTTYDGDEVNLTDYRGMPVVVNFWASWCFPCRDEQPQLEAAWRKYQGQVQFLGLSYLDQEPNARSYMEEFDVTYPNGPDKGSRIYTTYHVQGVPETFFIDKEGKVQGFHVGPLSASELERRIQLLLQSQQ